MNKLITTGLGGHPIYYKDFEFVQEQIRDLAKAALGHLDYDIVTVLNGCSVEVSLDGYTVTVTEGWAYYQGEFFHIPAHEATGNTPDVAKWRIIETWDALGSKTFKDLTVKDVYKVRQLRVGFYPVASEGFLFSSTVLPGTDPSTDWQEASVNSPYTGSFKYRKTSDNRLELLGSIGMSTSNFSTSVFVFDEDYRPLTEQRQFIAIANMGAPANITLKTNGELMYTGYPGQIPTTIYFSHRFILDE